MFRIEDNLDYKRLRIEGRGLTYWNAGYLQNTPISSNLEATSSSGKVLTYNGTEWISANPSGALGFAHFGRVLIVDDINGDDATGGIGGNPYKTIEASILAINNTSPSTGYIIWVMPGSYELTNGITIPAGNTIRGISLQSCIIKKTNVTSDTTLITMGENSRLEDITINLTSSSLSDVNLTGILFPNQTSTSAKVRVCLINITSNISNLTKTICGILGNGSTTDPHIVLSTNAVQRSTTNVNSSHTTGSGKVRGWYFTGSLQFSVRDAVIFAKGLNSIGVETIHINSFIIIKTSTLAGTLYDLQQPLLLTVQNSGIQLCATDLVNANASTNGFSVNIESSNLIYYVNGNFADSPHYLFPGTSDFNKLLENPLGIPFSQNVIIFGGILSLIGPDNTRLDNTSQLDIYLYNSTSSSSLLPTGLAEFVKLTVTRATPSITFNNKSSRFEKTTSFLHVKIDCNNISTYTNGVYLQLSVY
jgi:hypothetical protein